MCLTLSNIPSSLLILLISIMIITKSFTNVTGTDVKFTNFNGNIPILNDYQFQENVIFDEVNVDSFFECARICIDNSCALFSFSLTSNKCQGHSDQNVVMGTKISIPGTTTYFVQHGKSFIV